MIPRELRVVGVSCDADIGAGEAGEITMRLRLALPHEIVNASGDAEEFIAAVESLCTALARDVATGCGASVDCPECHTPGDGPQPHRFGCSRREGRQLVLPARRSER